MKKLLFTGGGGAGNEAINRLWSGQYEMHFADADVSAISPSVKSGFRHNIPFANDARFADRLADLCNQMAIDLLIPGVDEELPFMASVSKLIKKTDILAPDHHYIVTMLDKLEMVKALSARNIPIPKSTPLESIETINFPCIAKPRKGRGSRGFAILDNPCAATAYGSLHGAGTAIAQQLLKGQEYTVMMSADRNNNLRAVVPVRVEVKRGITLRAETDNNHAVINACTAIHNAVPTSGTYNIQLMLCDDGAVMPFEINPRISTTFCLAIAAGVNPVNLYLQENGAQHLSTFRAGVKLSRHWYNQITDMDEN